MPARSELFSNNSTGYLTPLISQQFANMLKLRNGFHVRKKKSVPCSRLCDTSYKQSLPYQPFFTLPLGMTESGKNLSCPEDVGKLKCYR